MTNEQKYINSLYKGYMLPPDRIPLIVSNTALAGNFFGDSGLAVVSFLMPVFFIFETFGFWINYGAFAQTIKSISHVQSADAINTSETQSARAFSKLALILSIGVGIILAIIMALLFEPLLKFMEVPAELHELANEYGFALLLSGVFLMVSSYVWQFVKIIGLQAKLRKIYVPIIIVDVIICVICVKVFGLGIISLVIGMIGAELFIILMAARWLSETMGSNLFADVEKPLESTMKIFAAGSSPTLGKWLSLLQVGFFNVFFMHFYGVEGVAIFAVLQIAIRVCRLHSQVTWQPISPILTMEFGDKNFSSAKLLFKKSMIQAIIFAALPAIVLYIGAEQFTEGVGVEFMRQYSASVVFAAINSIFLTAYLTLNRAGLSNALEFLRSAVLIVAFVAFVNHENAFYCYLFAETVTLVILMFTRSLIKFESADGDLFFVIDRAQGVSAEQRQKLENNLSGSMVNFIEEWTTLMQKLTSSGKNDFLAIHAVKDKITIRSTGRLLDKNSAVEADELLKRFNLKYKRTFTLGTNNILISLV